MIFSLIKILRNNQFNGDFLRFRQKKRQNDGNSFIMQLKIIIKYATIRGKPTVFEGTKDILIAPMTGP